MDEEKLKHKIDELFRDKAYEVFKDYHQTNSQTLQNIYQNQNGYSKFWKFMRGNLGAVLTIITVLSIIGSIYTIPIRINYQIQSIEKELKMQNVINNKQTENDEAITKILGEQNGRISKIEGRLEKAQ